MTTITNANLIFLGRFADADTNDGNLTNENPDVFLGDFDNLSVVEVTQVDRDDDGVIRDNEVNSPGDFLNYDAGNGRISQELDSTSLADVTITLGDGTEVVTQAVIIQTTNGDTFITEFRQQMEWDNLNIQSISVDNIAETNFSGFFTNQSVDNTSIVCFAAGSQILTPKGERRIDDLSVGDMITTLDNGHQPIEWMSQSDAMLPRRNAPITIAAGSLGPNIPQKVVRLSPQHRVLVRSAFAKQMFDHDEVLIPARSLLGLPGITQGLGFIPVRYYHLACRKHEIVFVNGLEAETFFPGPQAMNMLAADAHASFIEKFQSVANMRPARPLQKGQLTRKLIKQHCATGRSVVSSSRYPCTLV